MSELTYPMTAGNPEKHIMDIAKIMSDTYANGEFLQEIADKFVDNCHYDFTVTRLIWDEGKLIHHWGVWGYPMMVDGIALKTAGIGAVVTLEEYRKQGLMAAAAMASFEAMAAQGYDLSYLRGKHYVKFGYARAGNYVTYKLKPDELPEGLPLPEYRLLEREDMDAMQALYNEMHAAFSGTAVRPTYWNRNPGEGGVRGWFEGNTLVGYVRAIPTEDKKTLQCMEAVGDAAQGLAVLVDLFKGEENEYEGLNFFTLHENHPMLQRIRLGAVIVEDRYFYHTGWQVRIVNLKSVLQKLIPAFERRVSASQFAGWQGALHIDAGEQTANLILDEGAVTVGVGEAGTHAVHGGAAIGRLLIGADDADEIILQEKMRCTGQAESMVRVLFPNLKPTLSHWDEM